MTYKPMKWWKCPDDDVMWYSDDDVCWVCERNEHERSSSLEGPTHPIITSQYGSMLYNG